MYLNEELVSFPPSTLLYGLGNVGKRKLQFINDNFYFCEEKYFLNYLIYAKH